MKDAYGKEVVKGDLVYFRYSRMDPFETVGQVVKVRENIGLIIIFPFDSIDITKSPLNIKKLTDEEAMLWKLENS